MPMSLGFMPVGEYSLKMEHARYMSAKIATGEPRSQTKEAKNDAIEHFELGVES